MVGYVLYGVGIVVGHVLYGVGNSGGVCTIWGGE